MMIIDDWFCPISLGSGPNFSNLLGEPSQLEQRLDFVDWNDL